MYVLAPSNWSVGTLPVATTSGNTAYSTKSQKSSRGPALPVAKPLHAPAALGNSIVMARTDQTHAKLSRKKEPTMNQQMVLYLSLLCRN